jgi:hypothetical protein
LKIISNILLKIELFTPSPKKILFMATLLLKGFKKQLKKIRVEGEFISPPCPTS